MINGAKHIQRVVVLGGKSDLAISTLNHLPLVSDSEIFLVGKNFQQQPNYTGLGKVELIDGDLQDTSSVNHMICEIARDSDVDLFILAIGYLGMKPSESSQEDVNRILEINFTLSGKVLKLLVDILLKQKHGRILVFSSVAGLRPRSANYVYGAAKAGLDFLCRGFQLEIEKDAGSITIIRPGFVFTKMTDGLRPAPFAMTSNALGKIAARAVMNNKKIVYAPKVLKYVILLVKLLPNRILKKFV